jgi:hypothetical protein
MRTRTIIDRESMSSSSSNVQRSGSTTTNVLEERDQIMKAMGLTPKSNGKSKNIKYKSKRSKPPIKPEILERLRQKLREIQRLEGNSVGEEEEEDEEEEVEEEGEQEIRNKKKRKKRHKKRQNKGGDGKKIESEKKKEEVGDLIKIEMEKLDHYYQLRQPILCTKSKEPAKRNSIETTTSIDILMIDLEKNYELYSWGYVVFHNLRITHSDDPKKYRLLKNITGEKFKDMARRCLSCNEEGLETGFFCLQIAEIRLGNVDEEDDEDEEKCRTKTRLLASTFCDKCANLDPKATHKDIVFEKPFHHACKKIVETVTDIFKNKQDEFLREIDTNFEKCDCCVVCEKGRDHPTISEEEGLEKKVSLKDPFGDTFFLTCYMCSKVCEKTFDSMFKTDFYRMMVAEQLSSDADHRSKIIKKVYDNIREMKLSIISSIPSFTPPDPTKSDSICDICKCGKESVSLCNICSRYHCRESSCLLDEYHYHKTLLETPLSLSPMMFTYQDSLPMYMQLYPVC